jgi:hypothetical protein
MDTNVQFFRPTRYVNEIVQAADGAAFLYGLLSTTKFRRNALALGLPM